MAGECKHYDGKAGEKGDWALPSDWAYTSPLDSSIICGKVSDDEDD